MVFNKGIFLVQIRFAAAPAFAIHEIPEHMADLFGGEMVPVVRGCIPIDPYGTDIMAQSCVTHQHAGFLPIKPVGRKPVDRGKRMSDGGNIKTKQVGLICQMVYSGDFSVLDFNNWYFHRLYQEFKPENFEYTRKAALLLAEVEKHSSLQVNLEIIAISSYLGIAGL